MLLMPLVFFFCFAGVYVGGYFSILFYPDQVELYCVLILLPVCKVIAPYLPLGVLRKCLLSQVCDFARLYVCQCVYNCTVKSVVGDH